MPLHNNFFSYLSQAFTWLLIILAVGAVLVSNNNPQRESLEHRPAISAVKESVK